MNQRTILALVATVATTGILVTAFSIVISSASADSSTDQSAQKFVMEAKEIRLNCLFL
jgi:hypothetical protein